MLKRTKIIKIVGMAMVFSLLLSQGTYAKAAESPANNVQQSISQIADVRLQDDFYYSINRDWLTCAKIEDGKVSNSAFNEVQEQLNEQKKALIKELIDNKNNYSENSNEKKIINLYENYMNVNKRNEQGIEPIKYVFDNINNIKDVNGIKDLEKNDVMNPLINFQCSVDLKDATKYALYVMPTTLSLGNSDEYTKPTADTQHRKDVLRKYCINVLKLSGYGEQEADVKVENLFKIEDMIAPYMIGTEEASKDEDTVNSMYNVVTIDELDSMAPNLKIKEQLKNINADKANKIILSQPKWLSALNDMYNNENLQALKDYIEINNLVSLSLYLGEDFTKAQNDFANEYLGSKGEQPQEDKAISFVDSYLGMELGKSYTDKYFDSNIKADVEEMIKNIISNYKVRINNLDWMNDVTKQNAINKLDKLRINVAYPDKWDFSTEADVKSYDEGGSLLQNVLNIKKCAKQKNLKKLNENVDKEQFACSPLTVNAFYEPKTNSITIPEGILQKPLYNEGVSAETNYGAIGAIIGHEISHAFDNTGAKFDCDGNLKSWWTLGDYDKFKEKTKKVRDFYNTVKTDSGKTVNGDLTVGENIADISGVACTLDIVKQMNNPNYKDYFESYARIWRMKTTDQYADYCLSFDVHSPNKIRANVVLSQFEEFYKTYGINENDKMYIKPEDRLQIW